MRETASFISFPRAINTQMKREIYEYIGQSVSLFDGSVSSVLEIVLAFVLADSAGEASDMAPSVFKRPLLRGSHPVFDF